MVSNPDRVTICDAIRRVDAYLLLNINALSCFLNKLRINIILIFSKKHHIFWRWIELLWYIRCRSYDLDDLEQLQSWKSSQVSFVKISVSVFMPTERFRPSSFFGRSKALSYHSTQIEINLSIKAPPFVIIHNKSPTTQISSRASVISMPIFFTLLYSIVNFVGILNVLI